MPQNKQELLDAIRSNYQKLMVDLASVPRVGRLTLDRPLLRPVNLQKHVAQGHDANPSGYESKPQYDLFGTRESMLRSLQSVPEKTA